MCGGYEDIPHRAADRTIQWFVGRHFMSFSIVFSLSHSRILYPRHSAKFVQTSPPRSRRRR
jgi:hypothetical protein